jgi:sister-chromatid-cohesion protein PDS5
MEFLMKLFPLLTARKLPPRYNLIPFLTVHDPEADVKSRVSTVLWLVIPVRDAFADNLLCYTRITKHIAR